MTEDMPQGKEPVTDEEIISMMKEHPDPFFTSREIAERFDYTRAWAYSNLSRLNEQGRIERKKAGEKAVIWWVEG